MTKTLYLNILTLSLMPGVLVWTVKNIPSKINQLIMALVSLLLIYLYQNYGLIDDLVFSYASLLLFFAPCAIEMLLIFYPSNKHLKLKIIQAIYQDQIQLKVVPFKYTLIEVLELYFAILGFIFMCSFFLFGFGSSSSVFNLSPDSLLSASPVQLDQWTNGRLFSIFGLFICAITYFVLKRVRAKMLPIFWRAQLLPVFNPESEIYEKITEITDKNYLRQIFEVNDFHLVESNDDRVEQHNKNLNYVIRNYPLNILNIQQKLYIAATTIAVLEIKGSYHFYFVVLKNIKKPPPPTMNKVEASQESLKISAEPANAT